MVTNDIFIEADPATVWALTVDVERWPELTPTITSVALLDEGPLQVGSRARVTQPGQPAAVWTVSELVPGERFVWWTKVGPITMTGGHHLVAEEGGCTNHLTLDITGRFSRLVERLLGGRIEDAIDTENHGFRRAAEARHDQPAT